jgi:hypothetical protein
VVLEKDGDLMDRSCKKLKSITESQGRREYPTYFNTQEDISCLETDCLLNHADEEKIEG